MLAYVPAVKNTDPFFQVRPGISAMSRYEIERRLEAAARLACPVAVEPLEEFHDRIRNQEVDLRRAVKE